MTPYQYNRYMKYFSAVVVAVGIIGMGIVWMNYSSASRMQNEVTESNQVTPTQSPSGLLRDGVYQLNPGESVMTWVGSKKVIKTWIDRGSINLLGGTTVVVDGKVASGSVVVDMNSIEPTSTGRGGGQDGLARHLKSADFFDASQYPTATFVLSALTPKEDGSYRVEGSLTLKGITQSVSFDAAVQSQGDRIIMDARSIQLDRTKWQVKYGSESFFDNLGDNVINNIFEVSFTAVAVLSQPKP
jgi:polyisoprenoid-binding protein YceI